MVLANSMVTRMSIKNKVWLLGSFGLCLTVVVGALGFWGVSAVVTATEELAGHGTKLNTEIEEFLRAV